MFDYGVMSFWKERTTSARSSLAAGGRGGGLE